MHPAARTEFAPLPRTYLNTAGYGLPTAGTVAALEGALTTWRDGSADWVNDWDVEAERCRAAAGTLLGAPVDEIALLPAVSVGAGVVVGSLSRGDEILTPEGEFASVLLPALVAARHRGVRVRQVPFDALAGEVGPRTTLVVTSHVRSNDGRVQDLPAVSAAAHAFGAAVLVDATHAAGVLPVEAEALGLDYVLVAAYKHLLCPRGVALMRIARERWDTVPPAVASWRSAGDAYAHYYGPELADLAGTAARFDVSLAWHAWVGAVPALEFLVGVPAAERREWCVSLADEAAKLLGLPPTGSSVLAVPVSHRDAAAAALRGAGIVSSVPPPAGTGGDAQVRLSFHLYNDMSQARLVADVLAPFVPQNQQSSGGSPR
ncbi:aminotransferase class V-fold PLP-dependent enzyme [Dactylosporangium fulvum]|uniref:Aminotransferase class V-fold PLP-dependent enzyme n=1 Tax=Dactylosporangium fulvum TaxID=53359 RepID=A0ABY5VQ79_9ACTN|nr:aminotransferase class V-fold PLP-dependent enzyme [Dactylosporangium fulvum]UWP79927.1 aminotransferase class V-fold PLP-dependent enzyme [Dactylosporangium fulvum]